jgi:hypothetical protein
MDTTSRTNAPPVEITSTKLRTTPTPIPDGHSVTKRYCPLHTELPLALRGHHLLHLWCLFLANDMLLRLLLR